MSEDRDTGPHCPRPCDDGDVVRLAHGGGGRAMNRLIDDLIAPALDGGHLARRHDGAVVPVNGGGRLAFTTDSYVVKPLFFPGGDIGALAVNGTVNDLAMCGARPDYLSVALIMEEGLPLATLRRVVASMRKAADAAGVELVTGDTKVVDRGKADGLFINTAGIGAVPDGVEIGPQAVRPGDVVLVSGDIGRHGIAVMAAREALGLETAVASDCAPLHEPVAALVAAGVAVRCLRDLTRGGLASALVEIAESSGRAIAVEESAIPVAPPVRAACEILGLDPLHVANEGRFVAIVRGDDAERARAILAGHTQCAGAAVIGRVEEALQRGGVTVISAIGGARVLDMLSGEQLPRIC